MSSVCSVVVKSVSVCNNKTKTKTKIQCHTDSYVCTQIFEDGKNCRNKMTGGMEHQATCVEQTVRLKYCKEMKRTKILGVGIAV